MSFLCRCFGLSALLLSCTAYSATITGTVKGPDGHGLRAAFVAAQNVKRNVTVYVLSDVQGHYRIDNLPGGEYRLFIRAVGYKANPRTGVMLTGNQRATAEFAVERTAVGWNDISGYQGKQLFPPGAARNFMIVRCTTCHFFEHLWVPLNLDAGGWKAPIEYMKSLGVAGYISSQQETDLASYLASLFGPHSVLPKSPEQLPGYKQTLLSYSDDALNIVYVEYEMPQAGYFPFGATPDRAGNIWIPNHGATNKITRLNPKTGEMESFAVPYTGAALIHSVMPAPDGSVWLTESGRSHSLGRWDPVTQKITEYRDNPKTDMSGLGALPELSGAGLKHTVRVAPNGMVWSSGAPLTKLNPRTGKYTHFYQAPFTYDVEIATNGDVWFTLPFLDKIGKVDAKTLKVSEWAVPSPKMFPRRMRIAPDGMVWVGLAGFPFQVGKMARFDPSTQTFKEYPLPGADPSPYAVAFDGGGRLWYNSHYMDTVDQFDTKTGKVVQYPFPHSEITMREFFRDAQGHLWYGSNANNVVGYFYLAPRKH
jgi:virginiamycin B lyase